MDSSPELFDYIIQNLLEHIIMYKIISLFIKKILLNARTIQMLPSARSLTSMFGVYCKKANLPFHLTWIKINKTQTK